MMLHGRLVVFLCVYKNIKYVWTHDLFFSPEGVMLHGRLVSIPATVCTFIIGTETDRIIMMSENKLNFHHFLCSIHPKITSQCQHFRLTSFENLDISKISKLFSTFGEIHILPSAPSSYSQPTNDQIAKSSFSISSSDNNNFLSDIFNF